MAALAVCLFVAFPFATVPLVGAVTAELGAPDDVPDAQSNSIAEARPVRHAPRAARQRPARRPVPIGTRPAARALVSAIARGPLHLRC